MGLKQAIRNFFTPTPDSKGGDEEVARIENINGFLFETELGDLLAHGYEAYHNEGFQQGADDPTTENYEKQVELLKARLFNYIDKEILVKTNKKEIYEAALDKASEVVKEEIEYETQSIRLKNDLQFLQDQRDLSDSNGGWYVILEEALHDGFQEGAAEYFEKFKLKIKSFSSIFA